MRLGQLARKLNRKPQELVSFLSEDHQIEIENTLNSKVEGASLDLILEKFKIVEKEVVAKVEEPILDDSIIEEKPVELKVENSIEEEEVIPDVDEVIEEALEEVAKEEFAELDSVKEIVTDTESNVEGSNDSDSEVDEITEEDILARIEDGVIKAPKKELEGFKVVGKIELPSAKRPIQFLVTNSGETTDVTESIFELRKKQADSLKQIAYEERKARKVNTNKRKPARRKITEADLKAHQEKRDVAKRAEVDKKKKENKKKHYLENVQTQPPSTVQVKKKKEIQKSLEKKKDKDTRPAPKNTWEKFLRWLNT